MAKHHAVSLKKSLRVLTFGSIFLIMVKRYKLRGTERHTSERRPVMWVHCNEEVALLYHRKATGWEYITEHYLKRVVNPPPIPDECLDKLWADGEAVLVVGPDQFSFTKQRVEQGVSLSAAAKELARICGVSERSVWRWLDGAEMPTYAQRLLTIWADSSPEQRAEWFSEIQGDIVF
jgi:hypothetical protein